jgi:Flagellar Assembly Protein A
VDGHEVPAPAGRPGSLRLGAGVEEGLDGDVVAVVDGAVVYVPDRSVEVSQHYEHRGSVDLHSGHLAMEGALTISGDVAAGFRVRAAGDVDVAGRCEGEIRAGGDVRVAGLIRGDGVIAEGDVLARAAESVRVEAGGSLTLHDAVHGELQAGTLTVEKQVRGGRALGERWVLAGEAGSPAGTPTVLRAGSPRVTPEEIKVRLALARAQRTAQRGQARDAGAKPGRDSGSLAGTVGRTLERARRRDELTASAFIEVRGTVYAGTTFQIGERTHTVQVDTRGLRVSLDPDQPQLRLERTLP